MDRNISQKIKKIIATECGIQVKDINNNTGFMSNSNLSYFDCVDTLYTLEHKFHVRLPESDYGKYNTVGNLKNKIIAQLKKRTK